MNLNTFIAEKNNIIKKLANENIYEDDTLNRTYNFVSANLLHFLPHIDVASHETILRNIILNQRLSVLEMAYSGILDRVTIEDEQDAFSVLRSEPAIISTFHMGSNRLMARVLTEEGIPFSVVMANHIAAKEESVFLSMFTPFKEQFGHDLNIIYAQQPNAALKMLRELRNGRSLLVYMDGNTGAGDDSIHNENRCKIDFLNQSIYARKGIGYISHIANVPVIPAFSYRRNDNDLRIKFYSPFYPDCQMERGEYAQHLIQKVYDLFVPVLTRYPEQWECWIYLHTITDTKSFKRKDDCMVTDLASLDFVKLNLAAYGLFNIQKEKYLFNKDTYMSYRVGDDIYNLLFKSIQKPLKKDKIEISLLKQLCDNYVLINY